MSTTTASCSCPASGSPSLASRILAANLRRLPETWGTVGVAYKLIEASWQALVDSVEYKLRRDERRGLQ